MACQGPQALRALFVDKRYINAPFTFFLQFYIFFSPTAAIWKKKIAWMRTLILYINKGYKYANIPHLSIFARTVHLAARV